MAITLTPFSAPIDIIHNNPPLRYIVYIKRESMVALHWRWFVFCTRMRRSKSGKKRHWPHTMAVIVDPSEDYGQNPRNNQLIDCRMRGWYLDICRRVCSLGQKLSIRHHESTVGLNRKVHFWSIDCRIIESKCMVTSTIFVLIIYVCSGATLITTLWGKRCRRRHGERVGCRAIHLVAKFKNIHQCICVNFNFSLRARYVRNVTKCVT